STVTAETELPTVELLAALFPCASVTGAPKVSTMRLLAELETEPRGVYTGSVGFIAPGRRAQFNVAIRTVTVDRQRGQVEYGTGSGIT
ncbi:chorismate-binding protein, partial [Escherichia coli]|nr:chorismate-binding protein [Escherichia coli]